jgi:hypothetical protein
MPTVPVPLAVCAAGVLAWTRVSGAPTPAPPAAEPRSLSAARLTNPTATAAAPAAPGAPIVIQVSDSARLKAAIGTTALVTGTVSAVSVSRSGHRQVRFKQGAFILYISRKDLDSRPDWKLEDLIGKTIFAGGDVAPFYDKVEMLIHHPGQIADAPEKIDLAAARMPSRATKPPGSTDSSGDKSTDFEVKRTNAAISQISAVIQSSAQPYLAFERFEGMIEPGYRSSGVPVVIDSFSGRDRSSTIAGLEVVRGERGWPKSRILRLKRAPGGKSGPGLPHGLAVALLLNSMFDGWALPQSLAVGGTFQGVDSLAGGREELLLLAKTPPPEGTVLLVPDGAETGLADLALDGQWDALLKHTVLGSRDLDDAVRVCQTLASGTWNPAFAQFAETAAALRKDPAIAVKSPALRTRLEAVAKSCPEHLNARMLLRLGSKHAPVTYSSAATGFKLRQFYGKMAIEAKALRSAKNADDKKKLRALEDEFQQLAPRCHPDWKRFQGVLTDWLAAVHDSLRFDSKDTSSRAKKSANALKLLAEKAKAENEEAAKFRQ